MSAPAITPLPELRPEDPDLAVRLASAAEHTELKHEQEKQRAENWRRLQIAAELMIQEAEE